ncbi:helix-turn-helix domain-containing protein [Microlunatus antarcticus]|uniref:Helix-turn-helix domain-containing protein n=1 Tax=Microlunatus antarcticus TaxID=53388 RepID=A0A7W5P845_9ACTN|nr:helix-turn-helix domain-containing protein [Microlunatus antarcticus]MBB3328102.1 hypothetical protein [Microlunatus antarcticus]
MAESADGTQTGLTKGARITGDQRSSLGTTFGQRYAGGESIRSIAQDTGRSYGFVHGVLKESGATLRGRGGATRGPRRTGADRVEDQAANATETPASAVRTKAKAAKDKVEKAADKVSEKAAKSKSAKDDKGKKKAEPKKAAKKGKKG